MATPQTTARNSPPLKVMQTSIMAQSIMTEKNINSLRCRRGEAHAALKASKVLS